MYMYHYKEIDLIIDGKIKYTVQRSFWTILSVILSNFQALCPLFNYACNKLQSYKKFRIYFVLFYYINFSVICLLFFLLIHTCWCFYTHVRSHYIEMKEATTVSTGMNYMHLHHCFIHIIFFSIIVTQQCQRFTDHTYNNDFNEFNQWSCIHCPKITKSTSTHTYTHTHILHIIQWRI
jgi:hypothetical protein